MEDARGAAAVGRGEFPSWEKRLTGPSLRPGSESGEIGGEQVPEGAWGLGYSLCGDTLLSTPTFQKEEEKEQGGQRCTKFPSSSTNITCKHAYINIGPLQPACISSVYGSPLSNTHSQMPIRRPF